MAVRGGSTLRFAGHVLDVDARELRRGERAIELPPKALAILLHLAENAGRAVSRAQLLEVVWSGVHVEEAAVYQAVSQLRAALGSDGASIVRTVRSFGYRLGVPVEVVASGPSSPDAAAPLAGFLGLELATSFVGRAPELARLEALAASVEAGGAGLAAISGEPGIGKTRLATELAVAWSARGGEVLGGRCLEAAQGAYEPFVGAIADVVGRTSADALAGRLAPRPEELARLVPEIARRLPTLPPPLSSEPEAQLFALHEAVRGWLAQTAVRRPTLLVLDDLQWADPATLALLTHLVSGGLAAGLLLLALHRPVEPEAPLAAALGAAGEATKRIALEGLPARAVQQLLGDRESPWSGDDLRAWTAGNPFFVLEVLRAGSHREAPPGVQDVVRSRVGGLGTESAGILTAAAVLGAQFDAAALAQVAGVAAERVAEVLEAARNVSLVVAGPGSPGTWRFAHDIVRDALLAELPPRRRAALHGRALEALESGAGPGEPEAVAAAAYHAAGAGRRGSAIAHHRRLGELRLRGLAPRDAANAFETALRWLGEEPRDREGPLACDLLTGLATAQGQCAREEHWETARRAAEIARAQDDPERLGRAALALARPGSGGFGGSHPWRVEALRHAAAGLVDHRDPELTLRVRTALLADVQEAEFEASEAQGACIALERDAEALGKPALLAEVLAVRFYTHTELTEREARLDVANRLAQAARRAGDPVLISLATTLQARALFTAGRVAEADVVIESAIEVADRTGRAHARGMARHLVANRLRIRRRFSEARALVEEALAIQRAGGVADAALLHGFAEFSRRMEAGEFESAAEALARVVERRPIPNARAGLAAALAEQGRTDEARWHLDALLAAEPPVPTPRELEATVASLSAWAAARAGHRPAAAHLLAQLAPHAEAYAFSAFGFTGRIGHHVGALLATLGRVDEAIPLLEEAALRYRRDDAPGWEARACRDLAHALEQRGAAADRARIRELRARARSVP